MTENNQVNPAAEEALRVAKLGWRVLPLQHREKIPLIGRWNEKATTDERTIRLWANQYDGCNFGIATGEESGIFVIDIDPKAGGEESWQFLADENGVPETVSVRTGSGGRHLFFAYPKGKVIRNSSGKIGRGVDVRAQNGQTVCPGSTHPNGTPYSWINSPETHKVAKAPKWLLDLITEADSADFVPLGGKLERGSRNDNLYHSALSLARQGANRDFIVAALEKWLEDQHHFDIGRDEVEKTVDSAIKAAQAKPVELEDKSDTLAAELFIQQHGADLFYVSGIGWHVWDGRVWVPDYEDVIVTQKFIETMRSVQADAAARIASSQSKAAMKEAASTASWALKYLGAGYMKAAIDIASKLPGVRKKVDEIDGNSTLWLLNVRNGTIDLKTGKLYPHRKTDYITKMADVDYDPNAKAPFWESTLDLIFENHDRLITYVQRALGYTLTGTQDERCFFIAWGESGANGKSTLLETIQDLLGPYAKMSDMSVLASKESNNHTRASLAVLQGTRFVNVNEAEENQKLLESLIKQLTGGDTVQAEYKYKNPFEYKPAFKIWIRTNEKPVIRSQNNAIWDRIKLIPFERPIPKDKRLPRSEVDKRLREEFPGILAWMVRGCLDWQKNGLQEPEEVTKAVSEYRVESDIVRAFADECIVKAPSKRLPASSAYQAFVWWCKEGGEKYVMTKTKFTRRMKALGYEVDRITAGTVIQGVELTQAASMFMV